MDIYPSPTETKYDQGSEFIGNEFRKPLIEEEYSILSNPSTSGNTTSNAIVEQIHMFLGNLMQTYNIKDTNIDKDDPCLRILAA